MAHTCYRQRENYKAQIREKFNYTCQLCGRYGYEVDHIIPFAISHNSEEANLRILCVRCNRATRRQRKDALLPLDDWFNWLASELSEYHILC